MSYRVKTRQEIVDGMLATALAQSAGKLTDTNRGSVNRTAFDAASLQDADQYVQISRVKDKFSYRTCPDVELDDRIADFNQTRFPATQSVGLVTFSDTALGVTVQNTLDGIHASGSATLTLTSAASFPTSGSVIIERDVGGGTRELIAYSSKTGNVLTLVGTTVYSHPTLSSIILSTAGVDRVFGIGTIGSVPATPTTAQLDFRTTAAATILDGEAVALPVAAVSTATGKIFNVAPLAISVLAAPLFPTAKIANANVFTGGRDREVADELRARIGEYIQSLKSSTQSALAQAALTAELPSGVRVLYAKDIEPASGVPDVILYVDDGTGAIATTSTVILDEVLAYNVAAGKTRARLLHWPTTSTVKLHKDEFRGTLSVVTPGAGDAVVTDVAATYTPSALIGRRMVDANGIAFTVTANSATTLTVTVVGGVNPVLGAYCVLYVTKLTVTTDYTFNSTTGEIELVSGLSAGGALVASTLTGSPAYTYYTGLIQEVQRIINGDTLDLVTYPGVKARGIKVVVSPVSYQLITVAATVYTISGITSASVIPSVVAAIEAYINGLDIGAIVVFDELIVAAMSVDGVRDVKFITPVDNMAVADNLLPRTTTALISIT